MHGQRAVGRTSRTRRTRQVAEEYAKRLERRQDVRHQLRLLLRRHDADRRRARAGGQAPTDPDAIVEAIKKTNYAGGLMQYGGPGRVQRDSATTPTRSTTMIQILGQKPVAVWPKEAAVQKFVLPAAEGADAPAEPSPRGPHARRRRGCSSGLLFGGVYSLMAVGLTLIFGVMRVVNFAHGDMMVWGMYLAWLLATRAGRRSLRSASSSARPRCSCSGSSSSAGSWTGSWTRPTRCRSSCMLGVALVLENAALVAFGPEPQRVRSPLSRGHAVARAALRGRGAAGDLRAWRSCSRCALWLFLFRTDLGRTIRAAADNPYGALVIGTDVRRVYAVAFGIGAACVGAAGRWSRRSCPFQPAGGLSLSVASFNIVIIGGHGEPARRLRGRAARLGGRVARARCSCAPSHEGAGELLAADRDPALPARRPLRQARAA